MIYYIITMDTNKTRLALRTTLVPDTRVGDTAVITVYSVYYIIECSLSPKTLNVIILLSFITMYMRKPKSLAGSSLTPRWDTRKS